MQPHKRISERQRGRPADAEGQDLRTRILDEAEALFSTHGFSATPVRRIAEAAGVNPALVHYYFGDKKSLLLQVMQRATAPLASPGCCRRRPRAPANPPHSRGRWAHWPGREIAGGCARAVRLKSEMSLHPPEGRLVSGAIIDYGRDWRRGRGWWETEPTPTRIDEE